jgi:hypothetical protein
MIQTLPLLPAVPTPVRGPQADPGQADFGQWLAPPPAQAATPPASPLPDADAIAAVLGPGAMAPAAPVVADVGPAPSPVAAMPAALLADVPALLAPSPPQARVAPVVVHLMSPVPLTPLTPQAMHSVVPLTPREPAPLPPVAVTPPSALPPIASATATPGAPTLPPASPQVVPPMLPAPPISPVPPLGAPPTSLAPPTSPWATALPIPTAPPVLPPTASAPSVSLLPPTSPAPTASLPPSTPPAPPAALAAEAPVPASPPASPSPAEGVRTVWTLASRSGGETVDLFFTPWQLVAGHQLSQQGRNRAPGIATPAHSAPGPASIQGARGLAGGAMSAALARDAAWLVQAGAPLATAWATTARPVAAAASAAAESIGSGAPALGAAAAWPLRLLRWLNEGSQGATAWLRDFTLDADALPALVQDLQRFAASQDIPLHRIVLNGQTLWTSTPPTAPPSNHGETHAS